MGCKTIKLKMKRFLLLFALTIMSIASLDAATINGLNYTTSGDNATVTKGNYSGDVVIPSAITYNGKRYVVSQIEKEAFDGCSKITSISIPNTVTSIGARAFSGCYKLKSINIPNKLTTIYEFTFSDCSSLDTITIPKSVKNIFNSAFDGCESLKNVTLPNSIEIFRNYVFDHCSNLMNIYVEEGCQTLLSVGGILYTNSGTLVQYPGARVGSFSIPEGITTIGRRAFGSCQYLEKVTTPGSLTMLDIGAFEGCSSLSSVELVSGLKYIDDDSFADCISLKEIRIPETVLTIGDRAFYRCNSLTTVFDYSQRKSVSKSCYAQCSSLMDVNIPSTVTSINYSAFSGCSSLNTISIPKSVTSIDNIAFNKCDLMISVTCYAKTPPAIKTETFDVILPYLYVPKGTLKLYQASDWSKYFRNIIEIDEESGVVNPIDNMSNISILRAGQMVTIEGLEDDVPISIYSLFGIRVYSGSCHEVYLPENGVYLLIYSDKQIKFII